MSRKINEGVAMKYACIHEKNLASLDQYSCQLLPKTSSERILVFKSYLAKVIVYIRWAYGVLPHQYIDYTNTVAILTISKVSKVRGAPSIRSPESLDHYQYKLIEYGAVLGRRGPWVMDVKASC